MKARLDYLKTRAIVDLKTVSNSRGMPFERAVINNIASYRYDVQVAVYLDAVAAAKEISNWSASPEDLSDDDAKWIENLRKADEPDFLFVAQQTGVAPVARGYVFPKSLTLDVARVVVRDARQQFALCVDTWGKDPWIDVEPIHTFDDGDFPVWMTM